MNNETWSGALLPSYNFPSVVVKAVVLKVLSETTAKEGKVKGISFH